MSPPQVSRHTEAETITNFLTLCSVKPAGLLLAGEAGIGKTTLWMVAVEQARASGMHVLTTRAAATESVMANISLADLLSGVEAGVLYELPEPQRLAVDRVLLQVSESDVATDQRAVAAAFLSAVEILAEDAPVLVAIDDLQWLDPSSALVIGFAARRFAGPVGLLGTVRTGDGPVDLSWLQLPESDAVQRIDLQPLSIGSLQQVVTTRLGRTPSRRTMVRIHKLPVGTRSMPSNWRVRWLKETPRARSRCRIHCPTWSPPRSPGWTPTCAKHFWPQRVWRHPRLMWYRTRSVSPPNTVPEG